MAETIMHPGVYGLGRSIYSFWTSVSLLIFVLFCFQVSKILIPQHLLNDPGMHKYNTVCVSTLKNSQYYSNVGLYYYCCDRCHYDYDYNTWSSEKGAVLVLSEACSEKEVSGNLSQPGRMCRIQKGHEHLGVAGRTVRAEARRECEGCETSIRCPLGCTEGLPWGGAEHIFGWLRRLTQGRPYHHGRACVLQLEGEKSAFPLFKTRGLLRKSKEYLPVQMSRELKCSFYYPSKALSCSSK